MTQAISISNLTLQDEQKKFILKNINFNVNIGDFVVITGDNGVGKTSLIKIISGISKQTSGTIKIFGNNLTNNSKKLIGYIPQTNYYSPYLPINVEEVLITGLTLKYGIFKRLNAQDYNQIKDVANKLQINNLLSRSIGTLSGGQLQKVLIARALVQDAKILLMDEPLNNLDSNSQKEILSVIEDLYTNKNLTILFITHDINKTPNINNIKYFNIEKVQNV